MQLQLILKSLIRAAKNLTRLRFWLHGILKYTSSPSTIACDCCRSSRASNLFSPQTNLNQICFLKSLGKCFQNQVCNWIFPTQRVIPFIPNIFSSEQFLQYHFHLIRFQLTKAFYFLQPHADLTNESYERLERYQVQQSIFRAS